jgi:hypothetical protein
MKKSKYLLIVSFLFLFSGCAISEGPREKLVQTSFNFNEGLRWGRYNDVMPVVDAGTMESFTKMHKEWGSIIKISNAETLQTVYDEKAKKAQLTIKYTWYRSNEMVVYDTVTLQNWEYIEGRWKMMAEEYVSGEAF